MLSREWLSAFVRIGVLSSQADWSPIGAGVLLHDPPVVWLITAAHVVKTARDQEIAPLVTQQKGGLAVVRIREIQEQHGYRWHFDKKLCINADDLIPSMQCYTVGCPYGVRGFDSQRATPLVLDGVIAGIDAGFGTVYTSVPTFPGNSGGPIIVRRDPFHPSGGLVVGQPVMLLAGIILQASVVSAPESSDSVSLPPLHLGIGVSIDIALNLIRSEAAQQGKANVLAK